MHAAGTPAPPKAEPNAPMGGSRIVRPGPKPMFDRKPSAPTVFSDSSQAKTAQTQQLRKPVVKAMVGEHGATQKIPNESMRDIVKPKPVATPKTESTLPDISNRKTSVGATPASQAQTTKIPVVKSLLLKSGGEGSHGGNVVGHTKSGKAIYGTHLGSAVHSSGSGNEAFGRAIRSQDDRHPDKSKREAYRAMAKTSKKAAESHVKEHAVGFDKQDHVDAAKTLFDHSMKLRDEANAKGYSNGGKELNELATAHSDVSGAHMDIARKLHKKEQK